MSINQITVFLENRAGQLAQITEILAKNQIDMRALSIAETADYGLVRLIVDQVEKATSVLFEAGYVLSMTPVVAVAVTDEAGGLAPVLRLIADNQIDVEYMYSLFACCQGKAYMVFRIADQKKFIALMERSGIAVASKEDLGIR